MTKDIEQPEIFECECCGAEYDDSVDSEECCEEFVETLSIKPPRDEAKWERFEDRLVDLLTGGWDRQEALGFLISHGFGEFIEVEEGTGYKSVKY